MPEEILKLLKQISEDIGRLETKVEVINDRVIDVAQQVQTLDKTVQRREIIQEGVDGIRGEVSTKFMWVLGYCTMLFGITVALMKVRML